MRLRANQGTDVMIDEDASGSSGRPPGVIFQDPEQRLPAAELTDYRLIAVRLRKALAKSEARLLQKDELIHRQQLLKEESDHRLLNDLQMTDHQPAFAAEPQFDQSRSGLTIERGGQSGLDDCAHPPSRSFLRGRENN